MKTATGLLIAVIGGILIYDGFANRSIWKDALAIMRGQGIPTPTVNSTTPPSQINVGGGVGVQPYGPPSPFIPPSGSEQGPINPSPIPAIRGLRAV